MRSSILLFLFLAALTRLNAQQADIQINTPITNPDVLAAMEYTASIWEQHLVSPVPIKVNVLFFPVNGLFLGLTFPNGRKDFPGAPLQDTWYASCLANAITGTELNPGEADMDIVMAADANWYYGIDGQPGPGQFDFMSVFLHEIAHGLGIVSLSDSPSGEGSFGMIDFAQFAPFTPTFPTPVLDGFPGVYDRLLIDGSGALLSDTLLFPNPSITLHNAFTTNNVFFAGEESTISNGDLQPRIFAPPVYTFGVSISHLDENAFPNSSGNSLMTPYINPGEVEQDPGPLTLAILRDIGWNVTTSVSSVPTPSFPVEIWGLDRHRLIRADLPRAGELSIRLVDGTGHILYNNVFSDLQAGIQEISLDPVLQTLHSGYYLVQISGLGCMIVKSIILFP